jgi:hypothetical protein
MMTITMMIMMVMMVMMVMQESINHLPIVKNLPFAWFERHPHEFHLLLHNELVARRDHLATCHLASSSTSQALL